MERYRLKNIIILILVLLNLFLLAALAVRGSDARAARRLQQQELSALFAADGMTLNVSIPADKDLFSRVLTRDEELEQQAAAFLLGNALEHTAQGGGIDTYSSANGTAVFRDTGSFDAAGPLTQADAESFCREFCRKFSYTEPVFTLDEEGSGTAAAVRLWDRAQVFNGTVTFTIHQGTILSVSGFLLPESSTAGADQQELLTALAALTAFHQMRHESSFVVSEITEISQCYELQSTPSAAMTLVPSWRIVTDTAAFYVNCASGAIRRA